MSCRWCGKPLEQHLDRPDPRKTSRMPCAGLKTHYFEEDTAMPETNEQERALQEADAAWQAERQRRADAASLEQRVAALEERKNDAEDDVELLERMNKCEEPLLRFFWLVGLPPHMRPWLRPFSVLATEMCEDIGRNPERTVALRKLMEARDAVGRALVVDAEARHGRS